MSLFAQTIIGFAVFIVALTFIITLVIGIASVIPDSAKEAILGLLIVAVFGGAAIAFVWSIFFAEPVNYQPGYEDYIEESIPPRY